MPGRKTAAQVNLFTIYSVYNPLQTICNLFTIYSIYNPSQRNHLFLDRLTKCFCLSDTTTRSFCLFPAVECQSEMGLLSICLGKFLIQQHCGVTSVSVCPNSRDALTCLGRFLADSGFTSAPWSAIRYARCLRRCVSTSTSVRDAATRNAT